MNLWEMSLAGSVMICVILLIRALAFEKLPKGTFLILWGVALARLVIPFSLPSSFSVYSLLGKTAAMPGTVEMQEAGIPILRDVVLAPLTQAPAAAESPFPVFLVVTLLWGTGAFLCALFFGVTYLRCRMEFRTSLPVEHAFAERWLEEHALKRRVSIRQSDRIAAPLTYGVLRPVILMPKKTDWTNTKQLQYVLLHEYVHICRFDTLTKLAMVAALCIHWFNPFVWVMYVLLNKDIELACDESVVWKLGENSRSAYSLTLIDMEARKSGLLPFCNSFSKTAIETRITAIMKTKKITAGIVAVSVGLILSVAVFFATSAQVEGQNEENHTTAQEENQAEISEAELLRGEVLQEAVDTAQETTMKFLVEGMEEEVLAVVYAGAGYSLCIPEGYTQVMSLDADGADAWVADANEKVAFQISRFVGINAEQVQEQLEQSYGKYEIESIGNGRYVGVYENQLAMFQFLGEMNKDYYYFMAQYPSEAAEGFGVRLETIASTLVGEWTPFAEAMLSEDAQEIKLLAETFAKAYFDKDLARIQEYLTKPYEWDLTVYEDVWENVSDVKLKGLSEIENPQVGEVCVVSLEFANWKLSDTYQYLTMELEKQETGWKILFYGREG